LNTEEVKKLAPQLGNNNEWRICYLPCPPAQCRNLIHAFISIGPLEEFISWMLFISLHSSAENIKKLLHCILD
jgi:hypothetical protein